MGIFHELKQCKEPQALSNLNKYLKFNARLAEAKTLCRFVNQCIERCEFPRNYFKSLLRTHIRPTARTLRRHARNILDETQSNICELERLCSLYRHAVDDLNPKHRVDFDRYVSEVCDKTCERKYSKLLSSLNPLRPEMRFPEHPERYVHNFSSVVLSKLQLEALSLGPKFCHSQPKSDQIHLETQFENLMSQLTDLTPTSQAMMDDLKTTLVHCEQKYRNTKSRSSNMLTRQHLESIKELTKNPALILSRPDKGAGWVLLNKTDYLDKMKTILSDSSKFLLDPVQKNCSQKEENKIT